MYRVIAVPTCQTESPRNMRLRFELRKLDLGAAFDSSPVLRNATVRLCNHIVRDDRFYAADSCYVEGAQSLRTQSLMIVAAHGAPSTVAGADVTYLADSTVVMHRIPLVSEIFAEYGIVALVVFAALLLVSCCCCFCCRGVRHDATARPNGRRPHEAPDHETNLGEQKDPYYYQNAEPGEV